MRLPRAAEQRALAYLRGEFEAVVPRDAATVVLLRDGVGGLEAYLMRRAAGMAFAPQMHAFPGGCVDPGDAETSLAWAGPRPSEWAARLGCEESLARALVCAAARETFEESGVLLAGESPSTVVADTTAAAWEQERAALVAHRLSFAQFLARRTLLLRSDLLRPWAHWVTPEFEPRRYDTRFFVAALPPGQLSRNVGDEADDVIWLPIRRDNASRAELAMLPPTVVTLRELASYETVADVLAAPRRLVRRTPRAVLRGNELMLEWD